MMAATWALLVLLGGDPERSAESFYRPLDAETGPDFMAEPVRAEAPSGLSVGVHVGYFEMRDAEEGELFYGIHARLHFLKYLAAEASIDIAKADFIDDDAQFDIIPVQVTGMIFPFPEWPVSPYLLAGAGWYYTQVEYSGSLAGLSDDTESVFGAHIGAGAEIRLGSHLMIHLDLRYIFIDEPDVDNSSLQDEEFDYWQIMLGGSLSF